MDYGKENAAKAAYVAQTQAGIGPTSNRIESADLASVRLHIQATCVTCERLNVQRNRLQVIADSLLGEEPPQPDSGETSALRATPVNGSMGELVAVTEGAGRLLVQIDHQIDRLSRVSS